MAVGYTSTAQYTHMLDNKIDQKLLPEHPSIINFQRFLCMQKIPILIVKIDKNMPSKFIYLDFCEEMQVYCTIDRNPLAAQIEKPQSIGG